MKVEFSVLAIYDLRTAHQGVNIEADMTWGQIQYALTNMIGTTMGEQEMFAFLRSEYPDWFATDEEIRTRSSAPHSAPSPAPPEAGGGYVLNWQPIATAPKDGHTLLGKRDSWLVVFHWHKYQQRWATSGPSYERISADDMPEFWIDGLHLRDLPATPNATGPGE